MGRESKGLCTLGSHTEMVKALLESTAIVLRGPVIKRHIALSAVAVARVEGACLRFEAAGEALRLELGAEEAQKWLKKMLAPAPTLASKLGVGVKSKAYVLGQVDDAALAEALAGATTPRADDAAVLVAIVLEEAALAGAIALHARMPCPAMWVLHLKGKAATLGDAAIRKRLRDSGYMDNKASAVSERFTATRYARR